jgi:hypothetical protein
MKNFATSLTPTWTSDIVAREGRTATRSVTSVTFNVLVAVSTDGQSRRLAVLGDSPARQCARSKDTSGIRARPIGDNDRALWHLAGGHIERGRQDD